MKSLKVFVLLAAAGTCAWILPQKVQAQQASVSFQLFYDELSPYGMWVDNPDYGYVWIPDGDPGFSPYATDGHWIFTDDGWTWVSDYPWGWAAFHYGRWDYDDYYGWFWVPDDEWGPAWVTWRRSPGYYGWAPLRPGISVTISFGNDYRERNERWNFVRDRDIADPEVSRHYVDRSDNDAIINNSTVIVNTRRDNGRNATYVAGPEREDVQRVTRTTVESVRIRDGNTPGNRLGNGELQLYRPQVQRRSGNAENPVPAKVMRLNEIRPQTERNAGTRQQRVSPSDNARKDQQPDLQNSNRSNNRGHQQQQNQQQQQKQQKDHQLQNQQRQRTAAPNMNRRQNTSQPKANQDTKNQKDQKDQKDNKDQKDQKNQESQK